MNPDWSQRTTPANQPTSFAVPFTISPSITVTSPQRHSPAPNLRTPPAKNQSLKRSKPYLSSRIRTSTPALSLTTAAISGRAMYRYQATAAPASASQNGRDRSPCRIIGTTPWNSSAISFTPGWASEMKIELPKYPPNTTSPITQPETTEGIASSTSGTVTTSGDSCGGWWGSNLGLPWNA